MWHCAGRRQIFNGWARIVLINLGQGASYGRAIWTSGFKKVFTFRKQVPGFIFEVFDGVFVKLAPICGMPMYWDGDFNW